MRSAKETEKFYQLHAAYREAWQRFSSKVEFWHLLTSIMQADSSVIRIAEDELKRAELEYRNKRNQLADYILMRSAASATDVPVTPDWQPEMGKTISVGLT